MTALTPSQKVLQKELAAKSRRDSWESAVTGLGGTRDKTTTLGFGVSCLLSVETLDALYTSDDLAATIVEAIVEDAMSMGVEIQGDDSGDIARLFREHESLELLTEAATWGRLFGGGALYMGCADSDQSKPLVEGEHGPLLYTMVFDRREMTPHTYYSDPRAQEFGQVETYRLAPNGTGQSLNTLNGTIVHESRLLFFGGARTTKTQRHLNGGWDTSVLQRVYDVLRDAASNWRSATHAMADMSQAVFKVDGLIDMIAEGKKDAMLARMEIADMARSVARAVVIDAEAEDFTTVGSANLSAVPSLLDVGYTRVSAAAKMPVTRLMGKSPAGMNATGESDSESWYGKVEGYRERIMRPRAVRLAKVIAHTLGKPTADVDVTFPALWQMSDAETAALRKTVADTDKVYIDAGVLLPEEVMMSRFGKGEYSMETEIDPALDREKFMEPEPAPTTVAVDPVTGLPVPLAPVQPSPTLPGQGGVLGDNNAPSLAQ